MNSYSVVAVSVSTGLKFIGTCVSFEALKIGKSVLVQHDSCTGDKISTFAEVKEILSSDTF